MEALLIILGSIGLLLLMLVYSSLIGGLIMYKFWYWFLLPVFPGISHITFYQAIGLSIFTAVLKYVTFDTDYSLRGEKLKKESKHIDQLMYGPMLLLLGWLIHLFIN